MRRKRKDLLNAHTAHKKQCSGWLLGPTDANRVNTERFIWARSFQSLSAASWLHWFGVYSEGEPGREHMVELTSCFRKGRERRGGKGPGTRSGP